jgi:hypothetical protein
MLYGPELRGPLCVMAKRPRLSPEPSRYYCGPPADFQLLKNWIPPAELLQICRLKYPEEKYSRAVEVL